VPVGASPLQEPLPNSHDQAKPFLDNHPKQGVPEGKYRSFNPKLNSRINEPHPFPEYLKKFSKNGRLPRFYYELLQVEPDDQIQSKIFNQEGFRAVRRIGVMGFENKIPDRIRDENVGNLLANQFTLELQAVRKDPVIDPRGMMEDVRMKMVREPKTGKAPAPAPESPNQDNPTHDLTFARDKVDAVMIGAVTRFTNKYRNRRGEVSESLSAGVEFGAYLISTETGETLWGARFMGSQSPSINNLFNGRYSWLEKQELSRKAIKQIVKDFNQISQNP